MQKLLIVSAEVVMDAEIESVMASSHDQREEELQVLNQCKHLSVVEKKMRCKCFFMVKVYLYRGTVLWNMLSSRYTDLADTSLCNLVKKLKTSDLFKATKFKVLSASTASFEHDNFVYN